MSFFAKEEGVVDAFMMRRSLGLSIRSFSSLSSFLLNRRMLKPRIMMVVERKGYVHLPSPGHLNSDRKACKVKQRFEGYVRRVPPPVTRASSKRSKHKSECVVRSSGQNLASWRECKPTAGHHIEILTVVASSPPYGFDMNYAYLQR